MIYCQMPYLGLYTPIAVSRGHSKMYVKKCAFTFMSCPYASEKTRNQKNTQQITEHRSSTEPLLFSSLFLSPLLYVFQWACMFASVCTLRMYACMCLIRKTYGGSS
jgi:hypothetical protein